MSERRLAGHPEQRINSVVDSRGPANRLLKMGLVWFEKSVTE